jgi:hypothetical protein
VQELQGDSTESSPSKGSKGSWGDCGTQGSSCWARWKLELVGRARLGKERLGEPWESRARRAGTGDAHRAGCEQEDGRRGSCRGEEEDRLGSGILFWSRAAGKIRAGAA